MQSTNYILTSDFDAALISETHLERWKLAIAAEEARKFSWAGTGSAAISTANKGTSVGVLALVRSCRFSKPLSFCTDEAGVLCTNPRLAGSVTRVMGRKILLRTAYFEHSVGFRSDISCHFDARRVFFHERRMASIHFRSGFQFPAKLVAGLVHAWRQPLGPHCGVEVVLNINLNRRSRHNTNALQGHNAHHTEEADPALWNEARRKCAFEGKKLRCRDGQEDTKAACSQYASACGFLEEADELATLWKLE